MCASSTETNRGWSRWAPARPSWSGSMNACRRSGSARPSSFLAVFQDNLRRCRAARIVSRQPTRPNRSRPRPTRRRNVQRGAGSAPTTGGVAAVRWAVRIASLSSASRRGQKRDGGRRCGGTRARRDPGHCRRAPSPSQCGPAGPCARPPGGAAVLGDVKQGERPFARAGMRRTQGQVTQVLRCLIPTRVITT